LFGGRTGTGRDLDLGIVSSYEIFLPARNPSGSSDPQNCIFPIGSSKHLTGPIEGYVWATKLFSCHDVQAIACGGPQNANCFVT
jgi:hypothetical protein